MTMLEVSNPPPVSINANSLKRTLEHGAAKDWIEPDSAIVILCCARAHREKCGMSENRHAVARREERPLVQPAARIKRPICAAPLLLAWSGERHGILDLPIVDHATVGGGEPDL